MTRSGEPRWRVQITWPPGGQERGHGPDGHSDVVVADVAEDSARKHQPGWHRTEAVACRSSVADHEGKTRPRLVPGRAPSALVDLDQQPLHVAAARVRSESSNEVPAVPGVDTHRPYRTRRHRLDRESDPVAHKGKTL